MGCPFSLIVPSADLAPVGKAPAVLMLGGCGSPDRFRGSDSCVSDPCSVRSITKVTCTVGSLELRHRRRYGSRNGGGNGSYGGPPRLAIINHVIKSALNRQAVLSMDLGLVRDLLDRGRSRLQWSRGWGYTPKDLLGSRGTAGVFRPAQYATSPQGSAAASRLEEPFQGLDAGAQPAGSGDFKGHRAFTLLQRGDPRPELGCVLATSLNPQLLQARREARLVEV